MGLKENTESFTSCGIVTYSFLLNFLERTSILCFLNRIFLYNELFLMNTTMMDNEKIFSTSTSAFNETLNLKFREEQAI